MVSFRKLFTVLAVGLLLTAVASAQSNCSVSSDNPVVRAEGLTELTGAIQMVCTTVPSSLPQTLTTFFSVKTDNPNITNRITTASGVSTTNGGTATPPTGPVLYTNTGTPVGSLAQFTGANGRLRAANELAWDAVTVTIPAGATQFAVRIENIRVNASQVGAGGTVKMFVTAYAAQEGTQQLTTFVTNAQTTVAQVQQGMTFSINAASTSLQQCTAASLPTEAGTSANARIRFAPGFPLAFKTLAGEGPGATSGTKLVARFTVPANANLYVGKGNINTTAGYTVSLGASDVTGSDLASNANWQQVKANSSGVYQAAWTVEGFTLSGLNEPVIIPVILVFDANKPAVGTLTASGNLGPAGGSASAATGDQNVPRFAEAFSTPQNLINVVACSTTLLFPWVTNSDTWVTGIVINNSNQDIQLSTGTYLFSGNTTAQATQEGTCTLNYFPATLASGATAPPAQTTPSVAAGRSAVVVLSSTSEAAYQNFQGYVVANCNFQRAHGFAFMTSGQAQGGVGYNALVLPIAPRGTTESLGQ